MRRMTRKINGIFCGAPNRSVFLVHGAHFLEAPEQGSGGTEAPGQDLIARFASIVESLDELKVLLSSENLDIESPEIKTAISDLRARVIKILEGSDIDIMTEDETMDIADTLLALRDNALPLIDLVEKTGDVAERKKNTNHLLGLVNRILSDKLFEVWNTKRIGIDHLTGVKDRKYGEATIQSLLSRGRDGFILFVDVDDMKKINDENGHPEGDKALKAIADAMREATRKTDVVARVGGDEFLAFLPGFSDGEVKDGIVAKILAGVEKAGYEVTVGSHYVDPNKTDVGSDALKDVMSRNGWAGKEHLARAVCVFDIAKKAADDQMYELKKSKKVGR